MHSLAAGETYGFALIFLRFIAKPRGPLLHRKLHRILHHFFRRPLEVPPIAPRSRKAFVSRDKPVRSRCV